MAVTDLTGVSIEEWLTERPMLFALSSSVHSCGWMERGRSPYPQLKRWVRLCPSCSAICRCAVSQTSSMAAEAAASSQSACSISRTCARRIRAGKDSPAKTRLTALQNLLLCCLCLGQPLWVDRFWHSAAERIADGFFGWDVMQKAEHPQTSFIGWSSESGWQPPD